MRNEVSIVLGTAIIGAAMAIGYFYYTQKLPNLFKKEQEDIMAKDKKEIKRKAKKKTTVSVEEVPDQSPPEKKAEISKKGPENPASRLIDRPVEEILRLNPEQKEQIFYGMLVEGENLISQGKTGN